MDIDTLVSAGQLEQLICDNRKYNIPQLLSTERPDKAAKNLFGGRVVVLINGNPYCLIMPATISDFISSPEDTNLKPLFANFLKFLRLFASIIYCNCRFPSRITSYRIIILFVSFKGKCSFSSYF